MTRFDDVTYRESHVNFYALALSGFLFLVAFFAIIFGFLPMHKFYYGRQTLWDPTFLRLFFNAWTLVDDIPAMAVLEPAETFIIKVFWRQVII